MKIINARLRRQEALFTLDLQDGMIHRITAQAAMQTADAGDIDARGRLSIPPFVEPHIHLDATLTAGEPEWNRSGTLFEGITRWSQRKASITPEDTRQRAMKTIGMLRDFGVQHVRTHVDVTDPSLAALQALLAVKQEAADLIDLQIVAFPQEGIESYPNGRELMTRAIEMGADVVGGIPHYETSPSVTAAWWMSTAMKSTIRSRVSSKCWRKRRGCAAWGRRSPPATPARWALMITPTAQSCFAC